MRREGGKGGGGEGGERERERKGEREREALEVRGGDSAGLLPLVQALLVRGSALTVLVIYFVHSDECL